MADISQIKLPDGKVYDIKDTTARNGILPVPVPISQGGTGATTVIDARKKLGVVQFDNPEASGNFVINSPELNINNITHSFIAGDNQQIAYGNCNAMFGTGHSINAGDNSFLIGERNETSSNIVFIAGSDNSTSENCDFSAIISGYNNGIDSSENCSIAGGENLIETSTNCHIIGDLNNLSDGSTCIAIGNNNNIFYSTVGIAIGDENSIENASNCSVAIGYSNELEAQYSYCLGKDCTSTSSAVESVAIGSSAAAFSGGVAFGHYNTYTSPGSINGTSGTAFVIGNGTASSRSNCFKVNYNGSVYGLSSFNASGADYAEYKEWYDGNLLKEDRVGLFVTLKDDKIAIAQPDDFIAGIVSGSPSVIGNSDECWTKKYIRDDFGRFVYGDEEHKPLLINPDYNPDEVYISRSERPEWAAVGMLGYIRVKDDGSCKVNGYCTCGENGIATTSDKGYRVVKRINDNIVEILFSIY